MIELKNFITKSAMKILSKHQLKLNRTYFV